MKKLLLLAAMAALTMNVALCGQSITVTSPATGDTWCLESTHTITWTKSGAMPANVAVRLRRAGAPEAELAVVNITDSTANDGSLSWAIPASVPAGDYFIRVRTSSPDVIGNSGTFHINSCTTPSISVTQPNGSEWKKGSAYAITWTKSGTMPATVAIRLRRAGAPETETAVENITDSTANDGTSDLWTIPDTVPVGDYFIRVRTSSPDVIGDSVNFHIKAAGTLDPGILEKLRHYREWEIKWPPDPDPCLCPEWKLPDFRDFREVLGEKFIGSIVLFKNGVKLQELGTFGRGKALPGSVKANLNRRDFGLLKNGGAKFSIAVLDANGNILNQSELQSGQQELLR
jgi:hypothetical protein